MSSANSCTPPPHPALKLLRNIYNFCSACTPLPLKCVTNVAVYASTPFSLHVTFQDTGHRYCQLHSRTLILPATFQATDIPQWHPKAPILLAAFQSTASMATLVLTSCIISPSLPCTKVTGKHLKIVLFLHLLPLKYVINVAIYALSPWTHILEHEAQILPAAFKNIDFTSNILKHRYPQHPSSIQHPTASILLITFQNTISIPR